MIDLSNFKRLTIDGKKIVQLFMNDILVWRAYKNWVRYSINEDGSIYNNGLGYKDGIRVRSGGAEAGHGSASCTGFIPVAAGDIVRLSGYDVKMVGTSNAINVSDSSFTNLGQITANGDWSYGIFDGNTYTWNEVILEGVSLEGDIVYYWVVPDGYDIAYIRVTGHTGADGSKMIITINESLDIFGTGITNQVPLSIDTDGSIYNGNGYIKGYRLSSSGELKAQENTVTTGFIKASKNDVVRMVGTAWDGPSGYSYFSLYDDNFNLVNYINIDDEVNNGWSYCGNSQNDILDTTNTTVVVDNRGVTTFNIALTTNVDYTYIRISAYGIGEAMIVTVNGEII